MATVGSVVETVTPGGTTGRGFVLHDDAARPCVTLSYTTEEDAKRAKALIQEALDMSVSVVCSI